jgi:geranylgeranyl pyrophosphate synthase
LGGASDRDLKLLEDSAINIGYAFDIQDDIIDTYASEDQYGRPPCRDLALSKKPLHVIYALNSGDEARSRALRNLLGRKLNQHEIKQARRIIRESGGLEKAKRLSNKHAEKAKSLISKTTLSEETKEFFCSFIRYVEGSLEWYK